MTDPEIYPITGDWTNASLNPKTYAELYEAATSNPGGFWLDQATKRLDWTRTPTIAGDWSFAEADFHIKWFADGKLNVAANCIDRHLAAHGDTVAIIWEPDVPTEEARHITYRDLHAEVCRFANVLKSQGVGKGDRVAILAEGGASWVLADLAAVTAGAADVPIYHSAAEEQVEFMLRDSGSRAVFVSTDAQLRKVLTALTGA